MPRKRRVVTEKPFQLRLEYADTLFITAHYDKEKLIQLLTGYLLADHVNAEVAQTASVNELTPDHLLSHGEITVKGSNCVTENILAWYERIKQSKTVSETTFRKYERLAHEAENFINTIIPRLLDPILAALVCASTDYAKGNHDGAHHTLINTLIAGLSHHLSIRGDIVPIEVVIDGASGLDTFDTPMGEALSISGPDGLGGRFSFAWNFIPALNALNADLRLVANHALWGAMAIADEKDFAPGDVEQYKNEVYKACIEMADAYVARAKEHLLNEIEPMIRSAIQGHLVESIAAAKLALDGKLFGEGFKLTWNPDRKEIMPKLNKYRERDLIKRLQIPKLGGKPPTYKWTPQELKQMSAHYERLKPMYADAKKFFRTVAKRNTWREMIKGEYPELAEDLIEFWQSHDEKTYIYNYRPANQAIEHAARLSNSAYDPFGLTPQYLLSLLKPLKPRL